ncbi:MAG: FMN-binding protein [Firmicutes bacterium]|nr:FMN-binding protein [Bacillota bacterium]
MDKKQKYLIPVAILLLLFIIAISGAKPMIEKNLKNLESLTLENIDLSSIEDGIYEGKYKVFPIAAEANVIVKDHKITEIELVKHDNGKGAAAEVITDMVIEKQTLEIDVITGATYSSKVILKAIENALK